MHFSFDKLVISHQNELAYDLSNILKHILFYEGIEKPW